MSRAFIPALFIIIIPQFTFGQPPCAVKNDFTFARNSCNPLSVSFRTNSVGYNSIFWDFGDGNTSSGNPTPTNVYANTGNYQVLMIQNYGSCIDTVIKIFTVDLQTDPQLILTSDTTICLGDGKQLLTSAVLDFCWSPTTYLNNPLSPNPITSSPIDITYYLVSHTIGNNLIVNGNFNAGNTGFTSSYIFANPNTTEGEYFVGTNPQAWNPSTSPCSDHTTGNGNMMLVNGAPVPNVMVWSETIPVMPNTNYAFSTWIQAIYSVNPAQLQFSINGNDIGTLITASLPTCTWTQFYTTWNSGTNSTAVISIINKNTQVQGNDFALDDISFSPVYLKKDSIKVTVEHPIVTTNNNISICQGDSVQLTTTGANTYTWSPTGGLSNPNIGNPVAYPSVSTQYIVTGTTSNGCIARDTILITVNPKPTITKSGDVTICQGTSTQLSVSGGVLYSWTPISTLNNASIPNPIASPLTTTIYYITVTGSNSCINIDSIKVTVNPRPVISKSANSTICQKNSIQLSAGGGVFYSWTPASTLNNPLIPNPIATPLNNTTYYVTVTDVNSCTNIDSIKISVNPLPIITKSPNVTICPNTSTQLIATGGLLYNWSPSATLNDPNVPNPIATPSATTTYYVTVTDGNNCSNIDSILVSIKPAPIFTINPPVSACPADSAKLSAGGGDVYSWQPAASLNNPNIATPKASPSNTTVYSVHITENTCNYSTILSTTLTILPLPFVKAIKYNDITCSQDYSQLNASGALRYYWTPKNSLNNPNIASPIASPLIPTIYTVRGVDASGCSNYDSVYVNIDLTNKANYLMPNAFTPNNDGINDCYGIKYWGRILELDFSIYNRWGEIVFHTNNPSECWNGMYNGVPLPSAVFVYTIKAKTICNNYVYKKGTFVLIR